ncbi:MAG: antitermination regulator [Burkholderiales bacterium RIFCSPLOWO2_12_FULL_64_99]|nr:MAG: antitermination regulator [Burkholderiales bacterium RIFCSPHIGHO2_12_FULL_63_20]OGB62407.1 MAG: antitermination regulator [Burkholderiales bacterium RIFCSPLOWO2_12_FULL_64_99]
MTLSASHLVLRAKQLELDAVRHLVERVELAGVVGQLIDALQRERGVTSIYLASAGQRFQSERQAALAAVRPIEASLLTLFHEQGLLTQGATARTLSLMAWVLLDLQALAALRLQIDQRIPTAHEAVAAYSRVIAGLVELIYQLADAAPHPGISRQLVALVHLIQGKEAAGQERAVGAALFASGACSEAQQLRIVKLIDAQEHSLKVFEEFAQPALQALWQQQQLTPNVAMLERLRRTLCTARHGTVLDARLSDSWFEAASVRIAALWQCEVELVEGLRQACAAQLDATQQDLRDSEGLLRQLRDNPPPHTHAVSRFFSTAEQPDAAPVLGSTSDSVSDTAASAPDAAKVSSLEELLQAQTARLANMESELETARRALHERKLIERAKGALMARMGLTEDAAFRALQKTSMDHNRKLVDVAEAALALPELVFGPRTDTHQN